jgi:hypothetical protein
MISVSRSVRQPNRAMVVPGSCHEGVCSCEGTDRSPLEGSFPLHYTYYLLSILNITKRHQYTSKATRNSEIEVKKSPLVDLHRFLISFTMAGCNPKHHNIQDDMLRAIYVISHELAANTHP